MAAKQTIKLLLAFVLIVLAICPDAFCEDRTFGVMTWNIWQWGEMKPRDLSNVVKKSCASIVGLQESWNEARNKELLSCLGWPGILYGGKDTPGVKPPKEKGSSFWINGYYMPQALATSYEVLEYKYFNTINAEGYPDFGLPIYRGGVLAKLRLPSDDIVCVFVLHLMPWGNVEDKRLAEIKSIMGKLKPYSKYPTVVMGDFNTRSHLDGATGKAALVTEYMESLGFRDAYRFVHPDPAKDKGATSQGGSRIDYIFVNKHLTPVECQAVKKGVFGSEGYGDSDHLAVFAQLKLDTPRSPAKQAGARLFILSGQSNMAGLDPKLSFEPALKKAFAGDEVIVVKDAAGGQPIRRWYKKWKPKTGDKPETTGDLYDRLMTKVAAAVKGKELGTITFVWMQGERDAREKHGEVYAESLKGLIAQLRADLGRDDIDFVIGRLSDFDNSNKRYPHWTMVRKAQVQTAESDARAAWVDSDDLNGPKNGLHHTKDGYKELGTRFAEKAIELINTLD